MDPDQPKVSFLQTDVGKLTPAAVVILALVGVVSTAWLAQMEDAHERDMLMIERCVVE